MIVALAFGEAVSGFGSRLAGYALDSAPALLLGFFAAGLVAVYLPSASIDWLRRGGRLTQALKGVIVGLPLPVCSCGVVPLYRALIGRGAPPAAALAFLIATPELGVDAIALSVPLLGWRVATARVALAFVVALVTGAVVSRWATPAAAAGDPAPPRRLRSLPMAPDAPVPSVAEVALGVAHDAASKPARVLREGFVTTVDAVAPWLLVGLAIAALLEPLLASLQLQTLPQVLEVGSLALLGLPGYVCATAATPVAAAFLAAGASIGGALAFLITGPATNVTTFGILAALHGRRLALVFGLVVFVATLAGALAVNASLAGTAAIEVGAHASHGAWWEWAAAGAVGLLFAASLRRKGPRGWLAELRGGVAGAHTHAHGEGDACADGCGTEHGPAQRPDAACEHEHEHEHEHESVQGRGHEGEACCGAAKASAADTGAGAGAAAGCDARREA